MGPSAGWNQLLIVSNIVLIFIEYSDLENKKLAEFRDTPGSF